MSVEMYLSEGEARRLYAAGDAAHDFDHVLRVSRIATYLAKEEGADDIVVHLAALLHDVPLPEAADPNLPLGRTDHHLVAADYAGHLLAARGLGTERTANVVHSIEAHRFRDRSIEPQTLEAKCLYDADKLDSIGAIGIGRAFAYAGADGNRLWTEPWSVASSSITVPVGENYTPVHEYVHKLRKIIANLYTNTSRRIGQERHEFMESFFEQLDVEMLGMNPAISEGNL